MSSFIFVSLDPFVEDGSLIRQASGLTSPGSVLVPNLTLDVGIFSSSASSPTSQFQMLFLPAPWLPVQLTSLSSQPLCLLIPNFTFAACITPPSRDPCPMLFPSSVVPVQLLEPKPRSGSWTPSLRGRGVQAGREDSSGELANEKLTAWSGATCLQGEERAESLKHHLSRSCHGGLAVRIHGPDDGNSKDNGRFLVANDAKSHTKLNLRIQI